MTNQVGGLGAAREKKMETIQLSPVATTDDLLTKLSRWAQGINNGVETAIFIENDTNTHNKKVWTLIIATAPDISSEYQFNYTTEAVNLLAAYLLMIDKLREAQKEKDLQS